jgi:cobyrinic acid a,c-diamide synthase
MTQPIVWPPAGVTRAAEHDLAGGGAMSSGLIISAPRSGSGKTTVTLGLLAALARRGVAVRAAKSGPDYIDPGFHSAATGAASINLDSWAMPPPLLDALLTESAAGADLVVVEGAMGLFDGVPASVGRSGSVADIAARYRLPVVLVLDVSGQSQTAAAVLRGLAAHDPAVCVGGVVLNRVGSERHRALVADAVAPLGIPVLGAVPRDPGLAVPERHLGLVQAAEHAELARLFERLAEMAERHLDLDAIRACAAPLGKTDLVERTTPALPPPGARIALARDAAFSFVYAHVLDGWRHAGAEIRTFSPLADEAPPDDCDCCWLPGGYPELHAGALGAARRFRERLVDFAATRPVHGECGGFIALGESLEDASGAHHPMLGLLGHRTSFARRRLQLGYRRARLLADGPIGPVGSIIRGHEFHYVTLADAGIDAPLAALSDAEGRTLGAAGARRGHVTGAFFHAIAREPDA